MTFLPAHSKRSSRGSDPKLKAIGVGAWATRSDLDFLMVEPADMVSRRPRVETVASGMATPSIIMIISKKNI
jgi:hypothetical protein